MSGSADADGRPSCVFCQAVDDAARDELVLVRTPLSFVILNKYPYNNGHLLVVPKRHIASLAALTVDERTDLMELTRHGEMALVEAYKPNGINVGLNLGSSAGAGIADHLHVHLVPRWTGDTSFISVFGNTRVLPEALDQTAARLGPIFERLASDRG